MANSDPFPVSYQSCALKNTSSQIFAESKHLWNIFKATCFQAPSSVKPNTSKIRPKKNILGS